MDDELPSAADLRAIQPETSEDDNVKTSAAHIEAQSAHQEPSTSSTGVEFVLPGVTSAWEAGWSSLSTFSWGKLADTVKKQVMQSIKRYESCYF
jgi:hypothetical protein